jgi:serine/threonine protein kinase
VVKKSIMKDKLMSEVQHGYARQECWIHSRLAGTGSAGHENVVKLYDYTEDPSQFVLLIEYCNDASYFEDKIENVSGLKERIGRLVLGSF